MSRNIRDHFSRELPVLWNLYTKLSWIASVWLGKVRERLHKHRLITCMIPHKCKASFHSEFYFGHGSLINHFVFLLLFLSTWTCSLYFKSKNTFPATLGVEPELPDHARWYTNYCHIVQLEFFFFFLLALHVNNIMSHLTNPTVVF